ncbi:triacylglycerol lipase 2-like [Apium graveolens]|uniref:triacylglycerol lipase 2-like n=1 Tax=Apium graveolens TaxID=4045 RepID=UPI003D7A6031
MGIPGLFATVVLFVVTSPCTTTASSATDDQLDNAVPGLCSLASVMHPAYKCEEYHVVTGDGYIISMSRFPEGWNGKGVGRNKQPVLLQHGLLVDGMTWLLNSAKESLALILADHDYDVWIANTRGTRFSRRHLYLDPSDKEFWDWTWDDLVTHELSATIDFVFKNTGRKIHYVGHSLGTLTALAAFSEGRQVDKVKSAALLSPIAYISHITTALGTLAAKFFVGEITNLLGIAEFDPIGKPVSNILGVLCANPGVDCSDLITAITGPNCCVDSSTVDNFLKNEPQSTATKNMVHLAQTVRNGKLEKYNYGNVLSNWEHYGVFSPPAYSLSNIPKNLPLFLSYGGNDALSDVNDVQNLLDSLKYHEVDKLSVQYVEDFAHVDFIMGGVTAKNIVYSQVMAFFKNHH